MHELREGVRRRLQRDAVGVPQLRRQQVPVRPFGVRERRRRPDDEPPTGVVVRHHSVGARRRPQSRGDRTRVRVDRKRHRTDGIRVFDRRRRRGFDDVATRRVARGGSRRRRTTRHTQSRRTASLGRPDERRRLRRPSRADAPRVGELPRLRERSRRRQRRDDAPGEPSTDWGCPATALGATGRAVAAGDDGVVFLGVDVAELAPVELVSTGIDAVGFVSVRNWTVDVPIGIDATGIDAAV